MTSATLNTTYTQRRQPSRSVAAIHPPASEPDCAEDPYPHPLQKLWIGVFDRLDGDIRRRGSRALFGMQAADRAELRTVAMAVGWAEDTLPRLVKKAMAAYNARPAADKLKLQLQLQPRQKAGISHG